MKFLPTALQGAYLIEPEPRGDERGFFARVFCEREFAANELETNFVQANNSFSRAKGTLRGLHYQLPPAAEVKLFRCIGGALYDVMLDLRPDSPTYRKWAAFELTERNRLMLYIPRGVAHGYMTLEDASEVLYLVTDFYAQEYERGVRYDDPSFGMEWPLAPGEISAKDERWPDYDPAYHGSERLLGLV